MARVEGARRQEEQAISETLKSDPRSRQSYPDIPMMPDVAATNGHSTHQGTSARGTNRIIGDADSLEV
jgi:hypothetical protein